ncbi:MAG: GLPGLI family protein [Aquaticitalea sp.]
MSKFIFIISIFFITSVSVSQTIIVDYKIISNSEILKNISSNEEIPKEEIQAFIQAFDIINSMKMHLKADNNKSYYWGNNQIGNDSDELTFSLAKTMIGNDKKYFTNLTEGTILKQVKAFGETFLIKDSINSLDWILTKESKKIDKYLCFKATSTYNVANTVGNFINVVTAWYCPNIPYNFGPKNYSGLPGLILELSDDKFTYVAENIEFSAKKDKIESSSNGRIVSNHEFEELAQAAIESRGFILEKE